MLNIVRTLYHFLRDSMLLLTKYVISIIPKDKRLFLFTAWFGQKYADNTRFFYEYLLTLPDYKPVWTTKNKLIYDKLKSEGKPVVLSNTLKGKWTQIRARVLFSTIQLSDYDDFLLTNCLFIDLDHGISFKEVGYDIDKSNKYLEKHNKLVLKKIDYYLTTTSYLTQKMMKHSYHVNEENIILMGKPRLDYFFDASLRENDKTLENIKAGKKAIVYMPTHRSCGKKLLKMNEILDLGTINSICKQNNYLFIIKKHFYHKNEVESLDEYSNILDITNLQLDSQEVLYNADILVSDYSASYIDYLILDKPLILYTFDLDEYLKTERGLFVPFDILDIGYQPKTKEELNNCLKDVITDNSDKYLLKREKARRIYFDDSLPVGHFREQTLQITNKLLNKDYFSNWESIEQKEIGRCGVFELAKSIENRD